jgi:hypothetical protein
MLDERHSRAPASSVQSVPDPRREDSLRLPDLTLPPTPGALGFDDERMIRQSGTLEEDVASKVFGESSPDRREMVEVVTL